MNHTTTKDFEILLHDADHLGMARLTALCNYMQATADFHSRSLGTSMVDLEKRNLTWVYARFRVKVIRYPRCYETVSVTTWRSRIERAFGFREFELKTSEGSVIAAATSAIALIDRISRKPVTIPEEFSSQFSDLPGSALGGNFRPLKTLKEETSPPKKFPVLMRDIDINGHVNNVSYISWILESAPEEVLRTGSCHELEIHYRAEAFYGRPLLARISQDEISQKGQTSFLHDLIQGDIVTAHACTEWKAV